MTIYYLTRASGIYITHVGVAWNFLLPILCQVLRRWVALCLSETEGFCLAVEVYSGFCYLKFLGLVVDGESLCFCLTKRSTTPRSTD
jgi:hypothetical protein